MALQTNGPISLLDIRNEFGGTAPDPLSEYYGVDSGIPTSGTISIGDFYGASATVAITIANASYDNVTLSVTSLDAVPLALTFSPDGSKMFMVGADSDRIWQYSASNSNDLTTWSYDGISFYVGQEKTVPSALEFSPDGSKIFVCGLGTDSIHQYSTPDSNDVGTWSVDRAFNDVPVSLSVAGEDTGPRGMNFSPDGTKMFVVGQDTDRVYQYSTSNPNDLTTWSYDGVSFFIGGEDGNPTGIDFSPDGSKVFVTGASTDSIYQYSTSNPNDLTTWSYDGVSFIVHAQDTGPTGIDFSPDGTKMFMIGATNDAIYQYSI